MTRLFTNGMGGSPVELFTDGMLATSGSPAPPPPAPVVNPPDVIVAGSRDRALVTVAGRRAALVTTAPRRAIVTRVRTP